MKKITLRMTFDSTTQACIIAQSLDPELQKSIPQTNISLSTKKNTIVLTIAASQTTTLRAACNSYLRWIQTALSVLHLI